MNMKKSALAVAVATVIAAPAATTVFAADQKWSGRVHYRITMLSEDAGDEDITIGGAGHRIAVQGSGDTNGGQKVGYHVEGEIQNESSGRATNSSRGDGALEWRHTNVYLMGDWGKVTLGRQNNPQNRVYKSDIFERTSGTYELAQAFRVGDGLIYDGTFGAVGVWAGAVMDGQGVDGEDIDSTVLGASFNVGKTISIAAGLQQVSADGSNSLAGGLGEDLSITGIGADWQTGNLVVAGYYETESETEVDVIDIGAKFRISENGVIGGDYATADSDAETATRLLLGYYHNLGGGADWYVEWTDESFDEDSSLDNDGIGVGARVKFN